MPGIPIAIVSGYVQKFAVCHTDVILMGRFEAMEERRLKRLVQEFVDRMVYVSSRPVILRCSDLRYHSDLCLFRLRHNTRRSIRKSPISLNRME